MDCCKTSPPEAVAPQACPSCGAPGRRVPFTTVSALTRDEIPVSAGPWRFCETPGCEVVWFGAQPEDRLTVTAAQVPVFQKGAGASRPVCYCFGYTVADVVAGLGPDGRSAVADTITARCRRGEDRCEETNPQGTCCLGNVRAIQAP